MIFTCCLFILAGIAVGKHHIVMLKYEKNKQLFLHTAVTPSALKY